MKKTAPIQEIPLKHKWKPVRSDNPLHFNMMQCVYCGIRKFNQQSFPSRKVFTKYRGKTGTSLQSLPKCTSIQPTMMFTQDDMYEAYHHTISHIGQCGCNFADFIKQYKKHKKCPH